MSAHRFPTLEAWLAWQERLHPVGIELGLGRCREVATRMGLVAPRCPVVTVAGTNGKGSSVAMLEAILHAGGYRVGCYLSPHLVRYNERIRVDRQPVTDAVLCDTFARVDRARGDVTLTYFEFGTLAAFAVFADAPLDAYVLEVGLGGRLDAVNLLDPDVALITSIGLDHQDWLGPTRADIAREKAGIMRAGRLAVCSDHDIPPALLEVAAALPCRISRLGVEFHYDREGEGEGWNWWARDRLLAGLPPPVFPGEHQFRNAAGVLQVIHEMSRELPVSDADIRVGLTGAHLRGRYESVVAGAEYLLDVAHNVPAAEVLAAMLRDGLPDHETGRRSFFIFGIMADKDVAGVVATLDPLATEWHMVTLPGGRRAPADDLVSIQRQVGQKKVVRAHPSVQAAYETIRQQARPGDRVIVTGSHSTVGEMIPWLERPAIRERAGGSA